MFNSFILTISFVWLLSVGGCTSFYPYKMEIRQGNYVTAEMRQKIRIGMSRQQVTSVLGSPLVSDVFHANRWDYVYRFEEQRKLAEQQRFTLFFEGEFVKRIEDGLAENNSTVAPVKPANSEK